VCVRRIQTFILRLLIDADDPPALHGAVQSVVENQAHPFSDGQALLALLRQMVRLNQEVDMDNQVTPSEEE
jgi:hypothetical protein